MEITTKEQIQEAIDEARVELKQDANAILKRQQNQDCLNRKIAEFTILLENAEQEPPKVIWAWQSKEGHGDGAKPYVIAASDEKTANSGRPSFCQPAVPYVRMMTEEFLRKQIPNAIEANNLQVEICIRLMISFGFVIESDQ